MNTRLKAIVPTLLAVVTIASMTACSKDLPTDPTEKPGVGLVPTDIVAAAISANDDFDDAVVTTALPFTDNINTSEATTADDDPTCLGGGHTVWYQFTPTENIRINANTFGSDYDTGLSAYTGTRGDLTRIACNDDVGQTLQSSVSFDAQAGTTYFFMVEAFPGEEGGNLVFNVREAPPALQVDLTIDRFGKVDASTGVATITGTVTCSRPVRVQLFGDVRQRLGRSFLRGNLFEVVECDGLARWEVQVFGNDGLFVGGRAEVSAFSNTEDPTTGEEVFDDASGTVILRGAR
jgi:hypothetical protein